MNAIGPHRICEFNKQTCAVLSLYDKGVQDLVTRDGDIRFENAEKVGESTIYLLIAQLVA